MIIRTTDGGSTWISQSSGTEKFLYGVSFIDANTGTAVGEFGSILRTTNGGSLWWNQSNGTFAENTFNWLYAVSCSNSSVGIAVGAWWYPPTDIPPPVLTQILNTTNGGSSWDKYVSSRLDPLHGVSLVGANIGTAVGGHGTIIRTTDGGSTWPIFQESGTTNSLRAVSFTTANSGTIVGTNGTILHTTDGSTWISQTSGTTASLYAVSEIDANTAIVVGENGMILRTNSLMLNSFPNSFVPALAVSGTKLFAGTYSAGVFLSTNNSTSWIDVNTGLTNKNIWSLVSNGANLFVGTDEGVFLSTNSGTSWNAVNNGLTNEYVWPLTISPDGYGGTNLFAGTSGGGVFLSTNSGTEWVPVNSGLTENTIWSLGAIRDETGSTRLFAGTSGSIFLSTDNGSNWTKLNIELLTTHVYAFAVIGSNLFAGSKGDGVFLSTDYGANWIQVNNGLTNTNVGSFAVSGTYLFAGTREGGVFISSNNGTSWAEVNTGSANKNIWSLAVNGAYLFAGSDGSGVWTRPLTEVLPVELVSFNVTSGDKTAAISWSTATEVNNYGFEVERRFVGEEKLKWAKIAFVQGAGSSSSPKQYSFTDQPLAAGHYAYRLKQIDSDGSFKYSQTVEAVIETPKLFLLGQNYPNPFNPSTTITFDLPMKSLVTLKVFDLMGREVATIVSGELSAGNHTRQWNAANMSSGIYFYRLQAGSSIATKKLVLLK